MRKRIQGRTLSRNATQRRALKRTMLVSLANSDSIKTTLAKAKELKPFAERMITRAKKVKSGDKNSLAVVIRQLKKEVSTDAAKNLINIAKNYKSRDGGYLRIIKLVPRKSDTAEIAVLQWVGIESDAKKVVDGKNSKRKDGKKKVNDKK
jgi:large subunit ribosomal protein L17